MRTENLPFKVQTSKLVSQLPTSLLLDTEYRNSVVSTPTLYVGDI